MPNDENDIQARGLSQGLTLKLQEPLAEFASFTAREISGATQQVPLAALTAWDEFQLAPHDHDRFMGILTPLKGFVPNRALLRLSNKWSDLFKPASERAYSQPEKKNTDAPRPLAASEAPPAVEKASDEGSGQWQTISALEEIDAIVFDQPENLRSHIVDEISQARMLKPELSSSAPPAVAIEALDPESKTVFTSEPIPADATVENYRAQEIEDLLDVFKRSPVALAVESPGADPDRFVIKGVYRHFTKGKGWHAMASKAPDIHLDKIKAAFSDGKPGVLIFVVDRNFLERPDPAIVDFLRGEFFKKTADGGIALHAERKLLIHFENGGLADAAAVKRLRKFVGALYSRDGFAISGVTVHHKFLSRAQALDLLVKRGISADVAGQLLPSIEKKIPMLPAFLSVLAGRIHGLPVRDAETEVVGYARDLHEKPWRARAGNARPLTVLDGDLLDGWRGARESVFKGSGFRTVREEQIDRFKISISPKRKESVKPSEAPPAVESAEPAEATLREVAVDADPQYDEDDAEAVPPQGIGTRASPQGPAVRSQAARSAMPRRTGLPKPQTPIK